MRRCTLAAGIFVMAACALHGHRIDYSRLHGADRIEVIDKTGKPFTEIRDSARVAEGIKFIQRYQSGWKDPLSGPVVPDFLLMFYQGRRFVGAYGVGYGDIVSYPPADGFWSQRISESELIQLTRALGLPRPYSDESKRD